MGLKSVLKAGVALGALIAASAGANAESYYISLLGGASSTDSTFDAGPFSYVKSATRTDTAAGYYTTSPFPVHTFSLQYSTFTRRIYVPSFYHFLFSYSRQTFFNSNYATGFQSESEIGFVVGAAIGLDVQNGWRVELEAAYRAYDLGGPPRTPVNQSYLLETYVRYSVVGFVSTTIFRSGSAYYKNFDLHTASDPLVFSDTRSSPPLQTPVAADVQSDGELTSFSFMVNVWHDYQLAEGSPYTLILGAGLGMANVDLEYSARVTFPRNTLGPSYLFPSATDTQKLAADEWTIAWQLGAGLGYEFGGGMMLSAQYRYFSTGDVDLGGQDIGLNSHEGLVALNIPFGN